MKFIVVGPAQSGKTTFSRMLARHLGTKATDTSEAIVKIETERQRLMGDMNPNAAPFWQGWDHNRGRPLRQNLIALGDALKVVDQTILARYCFAQGDVCSGVRRREELAAVLAVYPDAHVVMLDAPDTTEDNFDITVADLPHATTILWNDKTALEALDGMAARVARAWGNVGGGQR